MTPREFSDAVKIGLHKLYYMVGCTDRYYLSFSIQKRNGDERGITAPMAELERCQRFIFNEYGPKMRVSDYAHGFVCDRSVVTNAQQHIGKRVVISIDIVNFFPSIKYHKVKRAFCHVEECADTVGIISMLSTVPGSSRYRELPQGACTSPLLSNAVCFEMDNRIAGLCRELGFSYTRYADDITLSGDNPLLIKRLIRTVNSILKLHGYTMNKAKTKIYHSHERQMVTGIVVNG